MINFIMEFLINNEKTVDRVIETMEKVFFIDKLFIGIIFLILAITFCFFPRKIKNVIDEMKTFRVRRTGIVMTMIGMYLCIPIGHCLWTYYIILPPTYKAVIKCVDFPLGLQLVLLVTTITGFFFLTVGMSFVIFPKMVKRVFGKLPLFILRVCSIFCFIISVYILREVDKKLLTLYKIFFEVVFEIKL